MGKTRTVHTGAEAPKMLSINFAGAKLTEFGRVDPASGWFKFRCALGGGLDALFEWMSWDVPGETSSLEKLDGKLVGGSLMLTPKLDKDERMKLKSRDGKLDTEHELSVDFEEISGFECHRLELEGRKGKGHRRELRFKGTFKTPDGAALFESYMMHTDNARGALKVTYLKEPDQTKLGEDEDAQQRLISESQAADTAKDD